MQPGIFETERHRILVASGTVSQSNMKISDVDGTAFVDFTATSALEATPTVTLTGLTMNVSNVASYYFLTNPSTDLSSRVGWTAEIADSAGKKKKVLLGAAGTGETLGDELTTGWTNYLSNYETLTVNANGHDIDSAIESSGATGTARSNAVAYTAGALYKMAASCTKNSGAAYPTFHVGYGITQLAGNRFTSSPYTVYRTGAGGSVYNDFASDVVNNFSLLWSDKKVLTPSLWGFEFSAPTVQSGFLYNSSTFSIAVTKD